MGHATGIRQVSTPALGICDEACGGRQVCCLVLAVPEIHCLRVYGYHLHRVASMQELRIIRRLHQQERSVDGPCIIMCAFTEDELACRAHPLIIRLVDVVASRLPCKLHLSREVH